MSMEPSWVITCDSGWSMEEAAAAAWSSDDRISFQTSLPSHSDSVQLQMVEYAAPATPTYDNGSSYPIQVFREAVEDFNANYFEIMEQKMHRFPPDLVDVERRYKEPVLVAIGPIHHASLLEAESVKHVAADQCIAHSTGSLEEMYTEVSSVTDLARRLYRPDDVAIFDQRDDFVPMMFFDACFLVQFMCWYHLPDEDMHQALVSYFHANHERISIDIMMLENQIPWVVVQTIFNFMPPAPSPLRCHWEKFIIVMRKGLKNQIGPDDDIDVLHPVYEPPHVLGLLRFYIVGDPRPPNDNEDPRTPNNDDNEDNKSIQLSISVSELADIGITLKREEKGAGLVDMRLRKKTWCFFEVADLFVRPLDLTEANAIWLVNMAAFELCKTPNFDADGVQVEDSAVCSYLHLFAMLLDRKQHVHELQKKHVIEGGGLTSKEALRFFISIGKNMRIGISYFNIIIDIERFKQKRSRLVRFILFLYKERNKVMGLISIIAAVVGILSSLQALKPR